MESRGLVSLVSLLLLVLVFVEESHARAQITDEDYWKAVWPNTPIPSPMQDLLKPVSFGASAEKYDDLHAKSKDACSTKFFFNNEIYPGKTMIIDQMELGSCFLISWDLKSIKREDYQGYTRQELCVEKGASIEDKYCADSLKPLMNYVISKLGKNVKPLLTSLVRKQDQYRVEGVTYLGEKAVMCHKVNFGKVTFYCHEVHGTTVYSVPLVDSSGTKTEALAACHFDTTGMNMENIRQVMKVDPGTKPICHFLGNEGVLWVPN